MSNHFRKILHVPLFWAKRDVQELLAKAPITGQINLYQTKRKFKSFPNNWFLSNWVVGFTEESDIEILNQTCLTSDIRCEPQNEPLPLKLLPWYNDKKTELEKLETDTDPAVIIEVDALLPSVANIKRFLNDFKINWDDDSTLSVEDINIPSIKYLKSILVVKMENEREAHRAALLCNGKYLESSIASVRMNTL